MGKEICDGLRAGDVVYILSCMYFYGCVCISVVVLKVVVMGPYGCVQR